MRHSERNLKGECFAPCQGSLSNLETLPLDRNLTVGAGAMGEGAQARCRAHAAIRRRRGEGEGEGQGEGEGEGEEIKQFR